MTLVGMSFFIPNLLFLNDGRLALIGYLLIFHGAEFYKRNQFGFDHKYLCYIEYFKEGNVLLGCHLFFLTKIFNCKYYA